jgi:hypothetical protein
MSFRTLLRSGSSQHWKNVLEAMTGSREMTVAPLLNYFKPLRTYLQGYITKYKIPVGWN